MTVGGWFDAEDLRGPLHIYKTIEKTSPKAKNTIVMGPFSHGGWSHEMGNIFITRSILETALLLFIKKI
jgi:predicted acyl esterase